MKIAVPLTLAWYFDRYEATLRLSNYVVGGGDAARAGRADRAPARSRHRGADLRVRLLRAVSRRAVLAHHRRARASPASHRCRSRGRCCTTTSASACSRCSIRRRTRSARAITPYSRPSPSAPAACSGKGWLNGTQTHLDFIPERTTDFIFAVYSEEFGLFGNVRAAAALPVRHRPRHGDHRQRADALRAAARAARSRSPSSPTPSSTWAW